MNKLPIFQKIHSGGIRFDRENDTTHRILLPIFILGIFIIFVLMSLRLFQLTIVKGNYYRRLSEQNRIREIFIEPQRGNIIDRKGFVMVKNIAANIQTNPNSVNKNDERINSKRIYEAPEAIAPLIGYRQTADPQDFKNDLCTNKLQLGDKIGKKGIEKLYECQLRGKYGKKLVEVDAKGNYIKTLTVLTPINGDTIQLSIDMELQKKAYELIKGKKAVVVAFKPQTGEILAFASSPSYSPQAFEDQDNIQINDYLHDPFNPMFNRVSEGVYPPGSIFKLVVASAALEEKAINEKTQFDDKGITMAGAQSFGNWYFLQYGKTEGLVDIVKAIKRSNDSFFYKTGEAVGPEKIKKWADIFGYGKETFFGLDESEGLIPSPFWKMETLKDRWYTGDTYNFSIGQGYVSATPLQTAYASAVFANKGYLCQPKLLKNEQPNCKKLPISQKTFDLIHEGMKEACTTGGTGWPLFDFKVNNKPIQVACKTGTAESHAKSGIPHAWISAFAPFDSP
ncbi:MAG: penicillin-binding transpeptidase domain-containing protein, partial [bacterium]|nr:penicillin-binding transpeptidase domain-containing protein [bacterium]